MSSAAARRPTVPDRDRSLDRRDVGWEEKGGTLMQSVKQPQRNNRREGEAERGSRTRSTRPTGLMARCRVGRSSEQRGSIRVLCPRCAEWAQPILVRGSWIVGPGPGSAPCHGAMGCHRGRPASVPRPVVPSRTIEIVPDQREGSPNPILAPDRVARRVLPLSSRRRKGPCVGARPTIQGSSCRILGHVRPACPSSGYPSSSASVFPSAGMRSPARHDYEQSRGATSMMHACFIAMQTSTSALACSSGRRQGPLPSRRRLGFPPRLVGDLDRPGLPPRHGLLDALRRPPARPRRTTFHHFHRAQLARRNERPVRLDERVRRQRRQRRGVRRDGRFGEVQSPQGVFVGPELGHLERGSEAFADLGRARIRAHDEDGRG